MPDEIAPALLALGALIEPAPGDDLHQREARLRLMPLIEQASLLAKKYDTVVANPPYMGGRGMNRKLAVFAKENFPDAKSDLMTCFMERAQNMTVSGGVWSMINLPSWMFLSSYQALREKLISNQSIKSILHLGRGIFGSDFGSVAFTIENHTPRGKRRAIFRRLFEKHVQVRSPEKIRQIFLDKNYGKFATLQTDLSKIPGTPLIYWVNEKIFDIFQRGKPLGFHADVKRGMTTSNNSRFLRYWPEISLNKSKIGCYNHADAKMSKAKWFPYSKGGGYRKWYGYLEYFVNWEDEGRDIIGFAKTINKSFTRTIVNIPYYFKPSVGFSYVTAGPFSVRMIPEGCLYDSGGPGVFADARTRNQVIACMNSTPAIFLLGLLNPTVNLQIADVIRLPLPIFNESDRFEYDAEIATQLVKTAKSDWDAYETSWDFTSHPLFSHSLRRATLKATYAQLRAHWRRMTEETQQLEEENNNVFIDAYGLQDELTPEVPLSEITLTCNPYYRYGGNLSDAEREDRLRADTMRELISYGIGCMMGRYSLAEPGLIYAHSGNVGFDPSRYGDFPADDDGIVPITENEWFEDDAVVRFEEFLKVAWSPEALSDLRFVAESLAASGGNDPQKTIRSYFSKSFFKDHLKTYKKRPIYWLFSSGKLKAFECLVYLHRFNEGTLSRMRMEYVTPLQSRMSARIEQLGGDIEVSSSSAERNRRQKERDKLVKQLEELGKFDEELRHYADLRIALDLDDGVKVNYGKFGNLLAEVKAVTGQ